MIAQYLLLLQLRRGRENAITARQLAALLDCTERTIRLLTREARREGHPIATGDEGYYWASNEDEFYHIIAQMRSRAEDINETVRRLEARWQRAESTQAVQLELIA